MNLTNSISGGKLLVQREALGSVVEIRSPYYAGDL